MFRVESGSPDPIVVSTPPKIEYASDCDVSVSFDWDGAFDSSSLQNLRSVADLDKRIENSTTAYQKVITLTLFVHGLWRHNGDNDAGTRDPAVIVQRALQGKEQFRCVEYACVLAGCLRAVGIPARCIALKMADAETIPSGAGHLVVEAFVDGKWMMIDPQEGFIPQIGAYPLNALEFAQHLETSGKRGIVNGTGEYDPGGYLDQYLNWIKPYLFYFDTFITPSEKSNQRVMLVPVGAKQLKVFQLHHTLDNFIYTNSKTAFYQSPECR